MIEYNQNENQLTIKIPVAGIQELYAYQKSILALLGEIEIDKCSQSLIENLKSVYRLLGHLLLDGEFLSENEKFILEYKDLISRYDKKN